MPPSPALVFWVTFVPLRLSHRYNIPAPCCHLSFRSPPSCSKNERLNVDARSEYALREVYV